MTVLIKNKDVDRVQLPYRRGVIAIVIDSDNKYLIVQMVDYKETDWRFPGGGIDNGESTKDALIRELKEELGTNNFEIVRKSEIEISYEWPDFVIERQYKKRGVAYRGQKQTQFLVRYLGVKEDIKLDKNELRQIKWVTYDELEDHFMFENQWKMAEKTLEELLSNKNG